MRCLAKILTLFGMVSAAGAAHAATQVITDSFDYSWAQSTKSPYTMSFSLVPSSPDYQVFWDTSRGTLNSVEIQWSDIALSMKGYGVAQKIFGISLPAVLAGSVTAQTTVNGNKSGVLRVSGLDANTGWMTLNATGNTVTQTYDGANDPYGVFADAANGDTLDLSWNTGDVHTLSGSSLPSSHSGLVLYGIKPVSLVSPEASLSGDLIVTFDYTPAAIPEPSTWALMLSGFAGLGFAGWRAARKDVAVAA